ncbi:HpcH/HpaI aldolase/citrate lyase family protein [Polycladidibacter hongkongensis]|uniref:HpcH/HpaI aldolase/citrate lyase family protein n=1 Tax=Polycladidibacter hongkongensis TaxID=1647556 RepID=UPI0008299005|nr:CoA ester lyase [Pseudovibrio hongkongensis]
MSQKLPHAFFAPLAIGAPRPQMEPPVNVERMIHFIPPHLEKIQSKIPQLQQEVDVILGNLEDAIAIEDKEAARAGLIKIAKENTWGKCALWARINALESPWALQDICQIVAEAGNLVSVLMLPKVTGPWDIHYLDQLLAQLEAQHKVQSPILIHGIIETAEGVENLGAIARASPRMQGLSLGPADLAASRGMKTTRVGGGHPDYRILADQGGDNGIRNHYQQDLWHYTLAKLVDACRANGIKAFYGPFGDFADTDACHAQFMNAFLLGCSGTWTLHPSQIPIARQVFSPSKEEIAFARKIIMALPDGAGAAMIDGKMQDDATWKQAKVIVELADQIAARDGSAKP